MRMLNQHGQRRGERRSERRCERESSVNDDAVPTADAASGKFTSLGVVWVPVRDTWPPTGETWPWLSVCGRSW